MSPGSLGKVLEQLGSTEHPNLLAGVQGLEDAGVYRISDDRALVQTVDFFPPIVDDPRWFGRIAAANSLSDVYAMGGKALTGLNIVGWPKKLDVSLLGEILAGGMDKLREAGAALCGGHSVTDSEIKYGLAVTGEVHPDRVWRNSGAHLGDLVLLSKPLGMGAVSTAIKKAKAGDDMIAAAMEQMAMLNKAAAEALADLQVHGATDVTGFGLLGHGCEMAEAAGLALHISAGQVPIFAGALELSRSGILSGGCARGRENLKGRVHLQSGVDAASADIMFDAETSGGLLIAVPENVAAAAQQRLADAGTPCSTIVGEFHPREEFAVVVE